MKIISACIRTFIEFIPDIMTAVMYAVVLVIIVYSLVGIFIYEVIWESERAALYAQWELTIGE